MADDQGYHNQSCVNALPLVLLLMPYALARHGWASWRQRRAVADDDTPRCNVDRATCYCTRRPGCPFADEDPNEWNDEPDAGDGWDIETVDTGGLL